MHAWEHSGVILNMQQLFIDQFKLYLDLTEIMYSSIVIILRSYRTYLLINSLKIVILKVILGVQPKEN